MIAKVQSIEQILDLEYVKLFLNNYDLTMAYLGIFDARELSQMLDRATKQKPYTKIRKIISSPESERDLKRQVPYMQPQVYDKIKKFKFYNLGDAVNNIGTQLMFESLISWPIMTLDWAMKDEQTSDPFVKKDVNLSRKERLSLIMYQVLNTFYRKANEEDFSVFNNFSYGDFVRLLHTGNFMNELRDGGKDSAFALYLLGHTDPRIDFLSLHFVNRNPESLAEMYTQFGEKIYRLAKKRDIMRSPEEIMEKGNKILSLMELDPSKDFQPEGQLLLPQLYKGVKSLLTVYDDKDISSLEYDRRITTLEGELEREKRRVGAIQGENIAKEKEIIHLAGRIRELEEKEPEFNPDDKYLELLGSYRQLEDKLKNSGVETAKLTDTLARNREQIKGLQFNSDRYKGIVEEKQLRINTLEGELSALNQRVDELVVKPALMQHYSNKAVLMIAGLDRTSESYSNILGEVFGYAEVAPHDKAKTQRLSDYDMIIVGTGHTSHSDRIWLEAKHHNVIVYPHGSPNMILKFLYDQLPKSGKPGKK